MPPLASEQFHAITSASPECARLPAPRAAPEREASHVAGQPVGHPFLENGS